FCSSQCSSSRQPSPRFSHSTTPKGSASTSALRASTTCPHPSRSQPPSLSVGASASRRPRSRCSSCRPIVGGSERSCVSRRPRRRAFAASPCKMPTEATFVLAGLLILFAALGWAYDRLSRDRDNQPPARISADYIRGLNLVLNRKTDEALELFVQMAKVDDETLETHFALGHLFRRRG